MPTALCPRADWGSLMLRAAPLPAADAAHGSGVCRVRYLSPGAPPPPGAFLRSANLGASFSTPARTPPRPLLSGTHRCAARNPSQRRRRCAAAHCCHLRAPLHLRLPRSTHDLSPARTDRRGTCCWWLSASATWNCCSACFRNESSTQSSATQSRLARTRLPAPASVPASAFDVLLKQLAAVPAEAAMQAQGLPRGCLCALRCVLLANLPQSERPPPRPPARAREVDSRHVHQCLAPLLACCGRAVCCCTPRLRSGVWVQ